MQWYYSKNGTQLGPVELAELKSKLSSGEISSADLVWKEGMADWIPASRVPELQSQAATATASPASTSFDPSPVNPPANSPYTTPTTQNPSQEIPNYLWQSIVVTIFCCWPLGIPAIVFAAKVDGLRARGDIPGALAASANAKKWTTIALISGLVVIIGYVIFVVTVGVGAAASGQPPLPTAP